MNIDGLRRYNRVGIHAFCGADMPEIRRTISGAFPDHHIERFRNPVSMPYKPQAGHAEEAIRKIIDRQSAVMEAEDKTVFFGVPIFYVATMHALGRRPSRPLVRLAQRILAGLDLLIYPSLEPCGRMRGAPWYAGEKGKMFRDITAGYVLPVFPREKTMNMKTYFEILRGKHGNHDSET